MVSYSDGSTIAQLSDPDMKLPIAYALAFPDRHPIPYGGIDWSKAGRLDFEPPDLEAFPCLSLAFEAGRAGGTAPAWLSAANEVAVDAFLDSRLGWADISTVIASTMDEYDGRPADSLSAVLDADAAARQVTEKTINSQ